MLLLGTWRVCWCWSFLQGACAPGQTWKGPQALCVGPGSSHRLSVAPVVCGVYVGAFVPTHRVQCMSTYIQWFPGSRPFAFFAPDGNAVPVAVPLIPCPPALATLLRFPSQHRPHLDGSCRQNHSRRARSLSLLPRLLLRLIHVRAGSGLGSFYGPRPHVAVSLPSLMDTWGCFQTLNYKVLPLLCLRASPELKRAAFIRGPRAVLLIPTVC